MAVKAAKPKNPAAVALGRAGGKRGGPARAAKLTAKQRSESARKAVQARWKKAKQSKTPTDTSDNALLALLKRLKATNNPREIRRLSNQIERVVFHKQFGEA
jgi:hypothetical protein